MKKLHRTLKEVGLEGTERGWSSTEGTERGWSGAKCTEARYPLWAQADLIRSAQGAQLVPDIILRRSVNTGAWVSLEQHHLQFCVAIVISVMDEAALRPAFPGSCSSYSP